jgi:N-methylhydantoinase A
VRVEVPPGPLTRAAADAGVDNFHTAHEGVYGFSYRPAVSPRRAGAGPGVGASPTGRQRVEWVNLRVTGVGPMRRPPVARSTALDGDIGRAHTGSRPVIFDGAVIETPLYDRARLGPGDLLAGPCIVEEQGSTTVVFPTLTARVDGFGNLILARPSSS